MKDIEWIHQQEAPQLTENLEAAEFFGGRDFYDFRIKVLFTRGIIWEKQGASIVNLLHPFQILMNAYQATSLWLCKSLRVKTSHMTNLY